MTGPVLSQRDDPCRACRDPLLVCPSTVRHFVRCCHDCTHLTDVDLEYYGHYPDRRLPGHTDIDLAAR